MEEESAVAEYWAEQDDLGAEHYAAEAEAAKEQAQELIDIEREKEEAIAELAEEEIEATKAKRRQALEEMVDMQTEFMNLGMNVVGLLTDALGDIASGEKSAEDAFKGMAKAFLQMISQYTALKAATEFADAIASFARYDYSGGAQHLAAGVAFTAVAVATGVGIYAVRRLTFLQAVMFGLDSIHYFLQILFFKGNIRVSLFQLHQEFHFLKNTFKCLFGLSNRHPAVAALVPKCFKFGLQRVVQFFKFSIHFVEFIFGCG